ncbi:cupin [Paenibacillus sp. GSMTC-2017]|uniref:cupin n=1 Tax=Paenibacillus sp. GSMTC-2017 TaxID=2794350 RepID=UPI0018D6082B|nr:cupin [Paenibacillus sp. GSMTC-2017]MBH5317654.1 cupin [Paenibacillus sp. GSMTC-2017]
MRIFDFSKEAGQNITSYESKESIISKIVKHNKQIYIGCIYIGQEGVVGLHKAPISQLFLVINGEGWVSGDEGIKVKVSSGTAAFWTAEEQHESGSDQGMTAIVIESEDLEPIMKELFIT